MTAKKIVIGSLKGIACCVLLVGAMVWAEGTTPSQPPGPTAEDQLAMETLETLVSLPDPPENSPHLAYLMKKEAGRSAIYDFAARVKLKKAEGEINTTVGREDLHRALRILDGNIARFADQKYGNKNGKIELEEFDRFLKETKNLPGIQVMREMFLKH